MKKNDAKNIQCEQAYRAAYHATVNEFYNDWFSDWCKGGDGDFPPIKKREDAERKRFEADEVPPADHAYLHGVCDAWKHSTQLDEMELTLSEQNGIVRWWRYQVTQWANREIIIGDKREVPPMPSDCIDSKATIPEHLLRVPGFISDLMDYTVSTAPYPNTVLAFAGATALLAMLSGRKVMERGGLRTNLYLLALAQSGSGKDHPRRVNEAILERIGMLAHYGESFASAEGLEDALEATPAMLFQTDEIDSFIRAMKEAKETRFEKLLETLKKIATSANGILPKRRKAGQPAGHIRNPHLVILGTAVPQHFYSALNERFLSDGFFGRMLVLESGNRGAGQTAKAIDPPQHILEQCEWWRDYAPGGNEWNPNNHNLIDSPTVVPYSHDAEQLFSKARKDTEGEYAKAERHGDNGSCAVWARVVERARQLALIYSISENCQSPIIGTDAAEWSITFAMRQARFTLERVAGSVAANPFDMTCLQFLDVLKKSTEKKMEHSAALRKMRIKSQDFREVVKTLVERGEIAIGQEQTSGRTATMYIAK